MTVLDRAASPFDLALSKIVEMGAKAVTEWYRKVWTPSGGAPFRKTAKRHEQDADRVSVYCEILDLAFGRGTRFQCRTILCELAVVRGWLRADDGAPGGFALAVDEEELYGQLADIPVR